MRTSAIGSIASSIKIVSAKIGKINLTDTGSSVTGWSNLNISAYNTPISINTTGWSIVAVGVAGQQFNTTGTGTYGDANFPDGVLRTSWQQNPGGVQTLTVSGLNTGKTYTVDAALAAPSGTAGDGKTTVTVGGASQTGTLASGPLFVKLTYLGVVSNGSGVLSISWTGANTFPVLNALIITEN